MLCVEDFESGFYGLSRCGSAARSLQVPVIVVTWEPRNKGEPALSAQQVQQLVFGPDPSIAGWFAENSQGRVQLVPHPTVPVVGPIQSVEDWQFYWRVGPYNPNNLADDDTHRWVDIHGRWEPPGTVLYLDEAGYVGGHIHAYAEMVCAVANHPSVDLAAFDQNGNHRLEPRECLFLLVKAQATPAGYHREVWASQVPFADELVVDGVIVRPIAELYAGPPHQEDQVAIGAEELLHMLSNLADQYPDPQPGFPEGKNRRRDDPGRPGQLSLTDAQWRPVHVDPYHKLKWGWLNPQVAHTSGRYTLRDAATTGDALILYNPDVGTDEFFLVENRWRGASYDQYRVDAWGEGLAIWQCIQDTDLESDWGRRAVHLRRADPRLDNDGNLQNGLALFDGGSPGRDYDIDDDSMPNNLRFRGGAASGLKIRNISHAGLEMFFDVVVPPQPESFHFENVGGAAGRIFATAGRLCATNPVSGNVYLWKGQPNGGWIQAGGPGSDFAFAGTKPVLYGRSPDGSGVWRRTWVPGPEEFSGHFEWQNVKGATGLLITDGGSIYATDPQQPGTSFYPNLSKFNDAIETWSSISGPARAFATGSRHVYRLLPNGDVKHWTGNNWQSLGAPGGVTLDTLYAGGEELFGTYHTAHNLTGPVFRFTQAGWVEVGGPGESFETDDTGGLYGISPANGSIWLWEGVPHSWTNLRFKAQEITATGNRMLFATSRDDNTVWQFMPDLNLSIVDWRYSIMLDVIRFYGVLVNRGRYASNRGKKATIQLVFATDNGIITEKRPEFEFDPDGFGACKTTLIGPVVFPFDNDAKYFVGSLTVSHPDESDPGNSSYEPSHEERIDGMAGSRFVGGGDLTYRFC
jgi:M6 family metalloprotease-like protein